MARSTYNDEAPKPRRRRATTAEARERQMINLATDLAEQQLRAGTASAAVTVHYLKLGSMREQLERTRLENENELLRAKVESLASAQRTEEIYAKALEAMQIYSGKNPDKEDYYD